MHEMDSALSSTCDKKVEAVEERAVDKNNENKQKEKGLMICFIVAEKE